MNKKLQKIEKLLEQLTVKESNALVLDLQNKLLKKEEEIEKKDLIINEKNEELKTWNKLIESDKWFNFSKAAKMLKMKEKKYKAWGKGNIFKLFRELDIFLSSKNHWNEPAQTYMDRGYFKMVPKEAKNGKFNDVPICSGKGLDFTRRKIDEYTSK